MRLFKSDIRRLGAAGPEDAGRRADREQARDIPSIASAQSQVEAQNFEIRKNLLKYDDVMNRQLHAINTYRRKVLEAPMSSRDSGPLSTL